MKMPMLGVDLTYRLKLIKWMKRPYGKCRLNWEQGRKCYLFKNH